MRVALKATESSEEFEATTAGGVAQFSNIILNAAAGSYTFAASMTTAISLAEATPVWEAIVSVGPPRTLRWQTNLTGCRVSASCDVGNQRMLRSFDSAGTELSSLHVTITVLRGDVDVGAKMHLPDSECEKVDTHFR